jgi:hypothetical protein
MGIRIMPIFPTVLNTINGMLYSIYVGWGGIISQFTFDAVRTYSLITIDEPHSFIHNSTRGAFYEYCSDVTAVTASTETNLIWFYFSGEAAECHLTAFVKSVMGRSGGYFSIYEDATIESSRQTFGFDRNRARHQAHALQIYTSTGGGGTLIYRELLMQEAKTEHAHEKMEFILLPNKYYLITYYAFEGETPQTQVILNWYETRV